MNSFILEIITNPLFSIFTGLVCFLAGHRFTIGVDKRKEFNEVADELFLFLEKEQTCIGNLKVPTELLISVQRRSYFLERCKIKNKIDNYIKCVHSKDSHIVDFYSVVTYHDLNAAKNSIIALKKALKRK